MVGLKIRPVLNKAQRKDYFLYVIDYKNSLSVDLMDCDLPDTDSSLFGVPTYYGTMQMLDPSVVREMASTRYTANSLLFE